MSQDKDKQQEIISADYDYPSHYVDVYGSRMHYIQQGKGDPIVFIHGMPTWSYLWRNILPCLADKARCIALDLIGMGQSDKPDIAYNIFDHAKYFEAFITELGLSRFTLVMHGWGSVVGFDFAKKHEDKIKALAFFESHVRPNTDWDMLSLPVQQLASLLNRPGASYRAIVEQNYLIKKLLPNGVLRHLTPEEIQYYEKPFPTPESRKPLWQYVQDLPLGQANSEVIDLIASYSQWLKKTPIPKLMMYAIPGFITTIGTVQWALDHMPNLTLVELPNALHFAQESIPQVFCHELRQWYLSHVIEEKAH